MSMRARKLDDYDDKRGQVQGEFKDTANKMFDNKADKAQNMQKQLMQTL